MANRNFKHIQGVGPKYAELLASAGVATVDDLAKADANALAQKLADANATRAYAQATPSAEQVAGWIGQANGKRAALANAAIRVQKSMLDANAYEWQASEADDPTKTQQDAVMFNRKEGYEVIPMIQKVVNRFGFGTVEEVQRVAAVIANELPGNVRSRKNVFNWLVEYFETH